MARAKLTDAQQTFIVQALACFDTPSEVVAAVKHEFGVSLSRQNVERYDPTKSAAKDIAKKWKALFAATRKTFLERLQSIPIAHRSFRLRAIGRMAENAERQMNYALAAQLLEQAAKEVGDGHTNKRQLTGASDGPIQTENKTQVSLSETDAALVKRFLG
jgi:hypothetical protein